VASRSDDSAAFGGVIEAFEAALKRGEQPRIADYLPRPDDVAVLVELLHVELEFKLKNGVEASVVEHLASFPQLAADRAAVVSLIEAEFKFQQRRDPSLERAAFLARYPEFANDLSAQALADVTTANRPGAEPSPTTAYAPRDVQPGAIVAGRYILVNKLGEGGMGEVWVAKQSEPVKRSVALKLIKPGMDSRAVVQRFEQERQALALMDHPNIAKVLDGGLTDDRQPFFVMELVNGLPLTRFCDEVRLGIRPRLELFVAICQAVQHAHQKGIVHRDLKPSNILVAVCDGKPLPKVIDFGVAKATGGKLALTRAFRTIVERMRIAFPFPTVARTAFFVSHGRIVMCGRIDWLPESSIRKRASRSRRSESPGTVASTTFTRERGTSSFPVSMEQRTDSKASR
jgi:hypothetical protein